MDSTLNDKWGIYGSVSLILAIVSCIVPYFTALFLGFTSVILGYLGKKKHQKLSLAGVLISGIVLLFANMVSMGIIPNHHFVHSNRTHLINSINGSIRAFETMKSGSPDNLDQKKFLKHLSYSLNEAKMVDVMNVDKQVTGFSTHYRNEFILGIQTLIDGYENTDVSEKMKGSRLLDKWAIWHHENRKNMEKIKENGLSFFSFLYGIIIS